MHPMKMKTTDILLFVSNSRWNSKKYFEIFSGVKLSWRVRPPWATEVVITRTLNHNLKREKIELNPNLLGETKTQLLVSFLYPSPFQRTIYLLTNKTKTKIWDDVLFFNYKPNKNYNEKVKVKNKSKTKTWFEGLFLKYLSVLT